MNSVNNKQNRNAIPYLQSFGKMFVDVLEHFIGRFMADNQDQKTQLALFDISNMIASRLQNLSNDISSLDFKNELLRIKNWTNGQNIPLDDFSYWIPANQEDQDETDISQENKDLYDIEPLLSASPTTLLHESKLDQNKDSAIKESYIHNVSIDPKASVNDKNISSNNQINSRQTDSAVVETTIAIHDYEKQEDGDLDFKENDTIQIIKKWPSGWAIGKNSQGQIGTIPQNHLKTLK